MRRAAATASAGLVWCARRANLLVLEHHGRYRPNRLHSTSIISTSGRPESLMTLAIETSCDDTCVAILEKDSHAARLHTNTKVTSDNTAFRGVEPLTAVESHMSKLAPLVDAALQSLPGARSEAHALPVYSADSSSWSLRRKPDFISVTRGPGMTASLSVGLALAKGLAVAWGVPLLAVHHMQAHALTPRLVHALNQQWPERTTPELSEADGRAPDNPPLEETTQPSFPFLSLLVSGGHTQLLLSRSLTSHTILAEAPNVAIGDMLDKCARLILPPEVLAQTRDVMYGAALEAFAFPPQSSMDVNTDYEYDYAYTPPARRADEIKPYHSPTHGWSLTPPLSETRAMAFDFSGLGGRVQAIVQRNPAMGEAERRELARETMRLAFEHLASRVVFALEGFQKEEKEGRQQQQQLHHQHKPKQEPPQSSQQQQQQRPAHQRINTLVISGGVASNRYLTHILRSVLRARGFGDITLASPPLSLCTDNAAMIGWAGLEMWEAGWRSGLEVVPLRRWSMDDSRADAASGGGGGGGVGGGEVESGGGEKGGEKQRSKGLKEGGEGEGGILGVSGWLRRGGE